MVSLYFVSRLLTSASSVPDGSFRSLFNRDIDVSCPVASWSTVHLVVPDVRGYRLSPEAVSSNDTVSIYSPALRCPLSCPTPGGERVVGRRTEHPKANVHPALLVNLPTPDSRCRTTQSF